MKVLFICSRGFDYIQDLTYRGLARSLGSRSVRDYPWNKKYHIPLWAYPRNIGYTQDSFSLTNFFSVEHADVVILGAAKSDAFRMFMRIVPKIARESTLVLLDGGDSEELCGDLRRDGCYYLFEQAESIRPFDLIFKREMHEYLTYAARVRSYPLTFGGKLRVAPIDKRYDVAFWGVESTPTRTFALTKLEPHFDCRLNGTKRGYSLDSYRRKGSSYLHDLSQCKVALNFRGAGDDTLRFWEILAMGSFLLTERPRNHIFKPFIDHKHFVCFNDDLGDLLEKCSYYLKHERERETIARAGHEHFLENHTLKHRIKLLLEAIVGHRECLVKTYPLGSDSRSAKSSLVRREGFKYPQKNEIKKICLIMYGLLGDVLIRTPLLRELRVLYPDAEITVLVDKSGQDALSLTKLVDKVMVVNRSRSLARVDLFRRLLLLCRVRITSFDLVIDLYMGGSSQLMARLSGAPYQIFAGIEETRYKTREDEYLCTESFNFTNPYHLGNQFLKALFFLSPDRVSLCTRPAIDIERLRANAIVSAQARNCVLNDFFLISLGAGDKRKIPDPHTIAKLCLVIHSDKQLVPLIIRNPAQEYLQESLSNELTRLGVPFRKLNTIDFEAIAALMLSVRFVMVPDTGLLHLAIGLGVKAMVFFPYTNPELVRPEAKNYVSIFRPDTSSEPVPGVLPYGTGTPSIEDILLATSSFRNQLEHAGA
jgi:ADP-heptose:LPS heptosyltransferase